MGRYCVGVLRAAGGIFEKNLGVLRERRKMGRYGGYFANVWGFLGIFPGSEGEREREWSVVAEIVEDFQ